MMRTAYLMAVLLAFPAVIGCSSDPASPPAEDLLAPPAEGTGVQFRMVTSIDPGQETERCQFFVAPEEGMYVNRETVRFTKGSHHVLVYTTPYKVIPTTTEAGVEVDSSGVMDCPNGASEDWELTGVLGGSQSYDGDSMLNALPEGVAVQIQPGAVLLMNTHYLNASSEMLETDARVNFYTMPKEDVKEEAGLLFYYNPFIHVPANGTSTARMRCPVTKDISIVNVQSHMHKRGVGFVADLTDGDGKKIEEIYTNTEWEAVPVKKFDPLLQVKAGQALDYRCDYQNTEARDIIQGATTKDEMCMLIGAYYPRDEKLENCVDDSGFFGGTWIGSGEANGADTMSCLGAATSDASFYSCIVNSCPSISEEVSDLIRCQATGGNGACLIDCGGGDQQACGSCIQKACEADVTAVSAATCG
jgi:hypothetical protein